MKKFGKLVATLLVCCFAFSVFGCTEIVPMADDEWDIYDVATDIVEFTDDGCQISSFDNGSHVFDSDALVITKKVERGYHKFSTDIWVDVNGGNNMSVGDLRVFDEDKNLIGFKNLKRMDFESANAFQTFDVTFYSEKPQTVRYAVNWNNQATMGYGFTTFSSIDVTEHIVQDIESYYRMVSDAAIPAYDETKLYYFNIETYIEPINDTRVAYDMMNLVTSLQGLVNREGQHLFVKAPTKKYFTASVEDYWLEELSKPGKLLNGKEVVELKDIHSVLSVFKDFYTGFVAWDENVPATSNVASTVCGVEGWLPLRYDGKIGTLYDILINKEKQALKLDLHGKFVNNNYRRFTNGAPGKIWDTDIDSTCSAKDDAYLWAIEKYVKTGKVNKTLMGWEVDAYSWDTRRDGYKVSTYYNMMNTNLPNKDYLIKNKAFFFDLCIHEDVASSDDKNQRPGEDFRTLEKLLMEANKQADGELIRILGFVPWWIKYTVDVDPDMPEGVAANEWWSVTLFTMYNACIDADAYEYTDIANASIYSQVQLKEKYTQKADTSWEGTKERAAQYLDGNGRVKPLNYAVMYMGDYDSSSWLNQAMVRNFNDPNLGKYPLAWPTNAVLSERVPHVMEAMFEKFTENDYMVGDHNGYGYFDLNVFKEGNKVVTLQEKYGDGRKGSIDDYFALAKARWTKLDLDLMGWTLLFEGTNGAIKEKLADLAPRGVIASNVGTEYATNSAGEKVPLFPMQSLDGNSLAETYSNLKRIYGSAPTVASFKVFRTVLKSPTFITQLIDKHKAEESDKKLTVVDPYVFMYLYSIQNGWVA